MEIGEACQAADEAVEDARMLTFELEAAEALAGLARSSSLPGDFERRRCQQVDTDAGAISLSGPTNTSKIVETTPKQANNTSNLSKVPCTVRRNLTEAEKEAQRLRRVLANRESARQTIRRRQAMYLELTGKAAKLSMENTYLKQERDLALKEYNYLKDKNKFLKAQMAKRKHAEASRIHDRQESSRTEISSSAVATTPICLHNRPSLFPFFWPFNSQCASSPDLTNASQFCISMLDESCVSRGQECSTAITKPRPPFFTLPVPWLLPSLSPSGKLGFHPTTIDQQQEPLIHQCSTCSSSFTLVHEDMGAGVYNSARVIPRSNGHRVRFHFQPDSTKQSFLDKNHGRQVTSSSRKTGNSDIAVTRVRKKRRELMKLKNIHSPGAHCQ